MKRNKALRIAAILMALVLATSIALTGTLAKYVAEANIRGLAARVAAFRVLVNGVDISVPYAGIPLVGLLEANRKLQADILTKADETAKGALHDDYINQLWMANRTGDNVGVNWNQFTAEDAAYWSSTGPGNRPDWAISAGGYSANNDVEWVVFPGTGAWGAFEVQNLSEVPVKIALVVADDAAVTTDLPVEIAVFGFTVPADGIISETEATFQTALAGATFNPLATNALDALATAVNVTLPAWNGIPKGTAGSNLATDCTKTMIIALRWAFNGSHWEDVSGSMTEVFETGDKNVDKDGVAQSDPLDTLFGASAAGYVHNVTVVDGKNVYTVRSGYSIVSSPYASDYMNAVQTAIRPCNCTPVNGQHEATCELLIDVKDNAKIPGFNLKNLNLKVVQVD